MQKYERTLPYTQPRPFLLPFLSRSSFRRQTCERSKLDEAVGQTNYLLIYCRLMSCAVREIGPDNDIGTLSGDCRELRFHAETKVGRFRAYCIQRARNTFVRGGLLKYLSSSNRLDRVGTRITRNCTVREEKHVPFKTHERQSPP